MKNKTLTTKASNSIRTALFTSLTLVENGLILKNDKKEGTTILFPELDKIYIKRCHLSLAFKFGLLLMPFFITSVFLNFLPVEVLLFVESILFIPLFVWMNNYKWYQLNVLLNDGAFYMKTFYVGTKYQHINLLNAVKKEIFDYHIKSNLQYEQPLEVDSVAANYLLSTLSIA
jgi:hypothetical protein